MRSLVLWDAGFEEPAEGFQRDLALIAATAATGRAFVRLWRRPEPALSAGRFHRIGDVGGRLTRRLSGGRVVPVGPGILAITLAIPSLDWLAPGGPSLKPEQVLNRALRPTLSWLRRLGLDAFYGGRDLVTVGGRPVALASFTTFADGAAIVEQMVAVSTPFSSVTELMDRFDPAGVAMIDGKAFADSTTIASSGVDVEPERLPAGLDRAIAEELVAGVSVGAPADVAGATLADATAFAAFQGERGPAAAGTASAVGVTMLGAVEATARLETGHVHDLLLCGDVLAPFATLDGIAAACEGVPVAEPAIANAIRSAMSAPGAYVLGARDLAAIIARLA